MDCMKICWVLGLRCLLAFVFDVTLYLFCFLEVVRIHHEELINQVEGLHFIQILWSINNISIPILHLQYISSSWSHLRLYVFLSICIILIPNWRIGYWFLTIWDLELLVPCCIFLKYPVSLLSFSKITESLKTSFCEKVSQIIVGWWGLTICWTEYFWVPFTMRLSSV